MVAFEIIDGVIKGITPDERRVPLGINALETDHGKVKAFGYGGDVGVQKAGKGVCGIDNQADVVVGAEVCHGVGIHTSGDTGTVLALDLLRVAFGRIVIRGTRFVKYPGCRSAFCCATENENHKIEFRV